jgi:hypothetical protein
MMARGSQQRINQIVVTRMGIPKARGRMIRRTDMVGGEEGAWKGDLGVSGDGDWVWYVKSVLR